MRKKHSFLLTIIPAEDQPQAILRGRVEFITTGDAYTFNGLQDLQRLIELEIQQGEGMPPARGLQEKKAIYPLNPPAYPAYRPQDD